MEAHPDPAAIADMRQMLASATRPLVILGGGGWSASAKADMETFASNQQVPVAVSFRRQDYFDNLHASYAGDLGVGVNPKLIERIDSVEQVPIRFEVKGVDGFLSVGDAVEASLRPYLGATGKPTAMYDTIFTTIPGSPAYVGKASRYRAQAPGFKVDLNDHNAVSGSFRFEG